MSACLLGVSDPARSSSRARACAVDRGELEHVAMCKCRRERLVRGVGVMADSGVDERRPHLGEHLTGHAGDDVDAQRRPHAALEQLTGRRRPVAHQHLDVRRDRSGAAGRGDQVELLVGRVRAVDVGRVRAHETEVVHVLDVVHVNPGEPHADVDGDPNPELACELPVVRRRLEVRVARRPRRKGECDEAVVRRERRLADPADVLWMLELAERPPFSPSRRDAVRVDRPDARVLQALDGGIRVLRRVVRYVTSRAASSRRR